MRRWSVPLKWILAIWRLLAAVAQDAVIDITLTRGTTGLGVHLVSEARGQGAVVDRVVRDSAASLSLRAGDVLIKVAGVEVTNWTLDNINRLLGSQDRVKLQIRRPPEPQLHTSDPKLDEETAGGGGQAKTASCYASVEGDTDDLHAFACTPATFGADLSTFSADGPPTSALPVVVAQPLELCTSNTEGLPPRGHQASRAEGGFALLVSRGGCLPGVKARNAALSKADVMILVDGQFPPFPPLPSVAGGASRTPLGMPSSLSAHSQASRADIPVLVVGNSTGYRIISEARDLGREVLVVAHAGMRPSRVTRPPRKQIPLVDSERLRIPDEAFSLASSFRDGQMLVEFGEPGPPSGESPTTFLQVPCELRALLTGTPMRIPFGRTVQCPLCGGRGAAAAEMRPCKYCSSSGQPGVSTAKHDHSREVLQALRTTCSHCGGFGEVAKKGKSCPRCKGERVVVERAWVHLTVPKGAPEGHKTTFPGVGSHLPGTTAGNVEVVVKTEPHETFTREGPNLRMEIPISLTEALSGYTRDIPLLNGTLLALNKTGMTSNNGEIVVEGGGLPVWDPDDAGGAKKTADARSAAAALEAEAVPGLPQPPEEQQRGSLIIACKVVFPESLARHGGRLSGLEVAGAEDGLGGELDE